MNKPRENETYVRIAGYGRDALFVRQGTNEASCGDITDGMVCRFAGDTGCFVISISSLEAAIRAAKTSAENEE